MKLLIIFALILPPAARAAELTNFAAFERALAMKETGTGWNGRPGRAGELSSWQITPGIWALEMPGVPFSQARDRAQAEKCLIFHVARLAKTIWLSGQRGAHRDLLSLRLAARRPGVPVGT